MPFQKGGRLVHPVTRLLLYRIYHILILFANTTSRFSAPIFHSSLNTDLGTLGARYLLHLVDEWNSGRKLSFAYTFSAIVMVSGDDAGSHGVFFIQGYGTGRDRIININTVNIGVNLECRLTAEMDVYIRNATVPVGISAFMLLGKLPIVSK